MGIDTHLCRWLLSAWKRKVICRQAVQDSVVWKILARVQLARYGRLVKGSGLFDSSYYLSQNPDVDRARLDPIWHYFIRGAYEGRNPHPLFDSAYYLSRNPDAATSKVNPLVHYVVQGRAEGHGTVSPAPRRGVCNNTCLARESEISPVAVSSLPRKAEKETKWNVARTFHFLPPSESNLLSLPNRELMERVVGGYWPDAFLTSGQETVEKH